MTRFFFSTPQPSPQADSPALLAAAQFLGLHALPAFLVALLLLLASVAVVWALGMRYGVRRPESRWPPLAYVVGHFALGFSVIALAAYGFAEIAELLGNGAQLAKLDLMLSDTLRDNTALGVIKVFAVFTHLADPWVLTALCALGAGLLVWTHYWLLALGWVLAIAGNGVLNPLLKSIFERTRPVHTQGLVQAEGWSFPSGHASSSVVFYGMLAYVLVRALPAHWPASARMTAVLMATAVAFTAGCSRVFLQVHFASDVLAGFASGTAWLAVCIGTLELARYRRMQRAG